MADSGQIMVLQEARILIQRLRDFDIRDYAGKLWIKQDQILQRLNMQAHANALMKTGQFIMQECVSLDKVKLLIYDLILTQVWKSQIFPLLKPVISKGRSTRGYFSIYHQVVVMNLLQVMMFHRTAVQQAKQGLVQLIQYCYRKLVWLNNKQLNKAKKLKESSQQQKQLTKQQKVKKALNSTPQEDLQRQFQQTQFSLSMMALTVTRYISDCVKYLQIGMIHHLVVQCDILCVLVPLIQFRPWVKIKGDTRQVWDNGKWQIVKKQQYGRLPKIQAQLWIAIYNLFMDSDCRKKYELNEMRKSNLLRLRKYMNQVLLDQLPDLTRMLRALQQLSMMSVPQTNTTPFIVQLVPQFRTKICYNKNWKEIAQQQAKYFDLKDQDIKQEMKRLSQLYSCSAVEGLIQGYKCGLCKKQAFQRCKRCKSIWYCSRDCQVADWPKHKQDCKKLIQKMKQNQQKEQQQIKKDKNLITQLD